MRLKISILKYLEIFFIVNIKCKILNICLGNKTFPTYALGKVIKDFSIELGNNVQCQNFPKYIENVYGKIKHLTQNLKCRSYDVGAVHKVCHPDRGWGVQKDDIR